MITYGRLLEDFRTIAKEATAAYWLKNAHLLMEEALTIFYDQKWSFHEGEGVFATTAPYLTGTISATNGSRTITGTGTTFNTNWPVPAVLRPSGGNGDSYLVTSFDSTTQLTLDIAAGWPQPSESGMGYIVEFPFYDLPNYTRLTGFCESRLTGWRNLSIAAYETLLSQRPLAPQSFWPGNYYFTPTDGTTSGKIFIWPAPAEVFTLRYRYTRTLPDFRYYNTGASATTNGSAVVTGNSLVDFRQSARGYDLTGQYFEFIGQTYRPVAVASVTDATHLNLASSWAGLSTSDSPYCISTGLLIPDDLKPLIRTIMRWKYQCDEAPQLAPESERRFRQELNRAKTRYEPTREAPAVTPAGNPWGFDWGAGPQIPTILRLDP